MCVCVCVCVWSLSRTWLFVIMDCSHQALLSMGVSRQEHYSGLSFPPPGDLLHPGIEPVSPALAGRLFTGGLPFSREATSFPRLWHGPPSRLSGKESACNAGDAVSVLRLRRSLGKEETTRSSIFAWEIPWTEEPGGLQSMGLQTVRHDLVTKK